MSARRSLRNRNALITNSSPPTPASSARPRRTASGLGKQVTIARESSDSPEGAKKAIHLTVKMPSNKLREATSSARRSAPDGLESADIITDPRSKRSTKKSYVVESESDEEEDGEEDAEDEAPIEDQIGEPEATDDDVAADEDEDDEEPEGDVAADEEEAESAEGDDDEDEEMEDASPMPPPPLAKMINPPSKPSLKVTPAQTGKLKSVEAKEMEMEDEDEDLSSINSEGDEDAEGEDVDEGDEMDQDDDRDIESAGVGSRGSTPDVSKMTKRQKSRLSEVMGNDFLQLPMEPQIKKVLTAEEHAMRRAEMARRRKNLSEKRNEEEKMDTINRLLKKQAPKRRGKISQAEITANAAAGAESAPSEEPEVERANPVFVRWVSDANGCRVGVPGEWLEGPAGRVFGGLSGKLVEEL